MSRRNGTHRVEIRAYRTAARGLTGDAAIEGGPAEQYLPSKYHVESTLTTDVDEDHTTYDFALDSRN